MKSFFKLLVLKFFRLFYKQMDLSVYYSVKKLTILFIMQKIIGINRKVPWPVHFTSQIICHKKIKKNTEKNPGGAVNCYIDGRNGIIIEENVWIGPGVYIISKNHSPDNYNDYMPGMPIIIRKNSLLLANSIILPGVELGEHTIVAAGSVVTKSFPENNQLIGGNPAKVLKKLGAYKS
ncbi:MAG: acyltransferase [Bacteroidales bacterium]|nr:acyltransferase [Bacteroidales bacterium]